MLRKIRAFVNGLERASLFAGHFSPHWTDGWSAFLPAAVWRLLLVASGWREVCVQSLTLPASSHPITYLGYAGVHWLGEDMEHDPALLEKAILDRKERRVASRLSSPWLSMVCLTD